MIINFTFPYPRLLDISREGIVFNRKLAAYTSNDTIMYLYRIKLGQLSQKLLPVKVRYPSDKLPGARIESGAMLFFVDFIASFRFLCHP